jgi:hypothetical protein
MSPNSTVERRASVPRLTSVSVNGTHVGAQIKHNVQRESRTCAKDNVVYYLAARRRHLDILAQAWLEPGERAQLK